MDRRNGFSWRAWVVALLWWAVGIGSAPHVSAQETDPPNPDATVPVAPLPASEFQGWTNAFRLANTNLELVIVPALGRVMSLRYRGGENLLRFAPSHAGTVPDKKSGEWINAGGEWLWPMAQSAWLSIAGHDWPPPEFLSDAPWTATAWIAADGSVNGMLSRTYGRPLHIKVSRTIRLDPEKPEFIIRQRIERTREAQTPVTFWNVFQIEAAEKIIIPIDNASSFDRGFRPMMFECPPTNQLIACDGTIVYDVSAGEHKLCSDSNRRWIAAWKGRTAVVMRIRDEGTDGAYPDGGCRVEMYSNTGLGYTEIETLSRETVLADGAAAQTELLVQILDIAPSDSCGIAAVVRTAIGDITTPAQNVLALETQTGTNQTAAAP